MADPIPGPARDLVRVVIEAVESAVHASDAVGYDCVIAQMGFHPAGGRLIADLLRSLLEDTHPDGLSSDDITLVVGRCYRSAVAWLPPDRVDVTLLLMTMASVLGLGDMEPCHDGIEESHEIDDDVPAKPSTWSDYAWHAPLLVADLLPYAPGTLTSYVESAFAEYAREAREEFP